MSTFFGAGVLIVDGRQAASEGVLIDDIDVAKAIDKISIDEIARAAQQIAKIGGQLVSENQRGGSIGTRLLRRPRPYSEPAHVSCHYRS